MIAAVELPAGIDELEARARAEAGALLAALPPQALRRRRLARGEDLLAADAPGRALLHEGVFRLEHAGRLVRLYEEGDLAPAGLRPELAGFRLASEFAAEVSVVDDAVLLAAVSADARLLGHAFALRDCELAIVLLLCAALAADTAAPELDLREVAAGETIVREGDPAAELYQMVSGDAAVTLEGTEIGEIAADEIFGEVSLLAGLPRVSTVTARTDCLMHVIREPDLSALMRARPRLAEEMTRGLARRLADADRKLAARRG